MTPVRWLVGLPFRWADRRVAVALDVAQVYPIEADMPRKLHITHYTHKTCGWMVTCTCGFRAGRLPDRITAVDVGANHHLRAAS